MFRTWKLGSYWQSSAREANERKCLRDGPFKDQFLYPLIKLDFLGELSTKIVVCTVVYIYMVLSIKSILPRGTRPLGSPISEWHVVGIIQAQTGISQLNTSSNDVTEITEQKLNKTIPEKESPILTQSKDARWESWSWVLTSAFLRCIENAVWNFKFGTPIRPEVELRSPGYTRKADFWQMPWTDILRPCLKFGS